MCFARAEAEWPVSGPEWRGGTKWRGAFLAYLPEAGETIARLLDRSDGLAAFERFHFGGDWDADGTVMPRAIAQAVGRPDTYVKALPCALIGLAGLFQQTPRELYKMRCLWNTTVRLDNSKLVAFLGKEPHMPLNEAVAATLAGLSIS